MSLPSLYIHIPFCLSRCGYCTFVSNVYSEAGADAYLSALENEWLHKKSLFTHPPETLFIGGGTPSALSPAQLARLLKILPAITGEATCELNPETASYDKLSLLFDHGINRCSFGVQTFSPKGRNMLQRRHSGDDAETAVRNAQKAGFQSINIDLIHSWPGQTREDIMEDINKSIRLEIQHLSYYALILDEKARSFKALSDLLTDSCDEKDREFWDTIEVALERHGLTHYETSNFARSGFACQHNVAIWQGGEYLGLGVGAHSHWSGRRFANTEELGEYIRRGGVGAEAFSEKLEGLEKARETTVFWLRLFEGIDLAAYRERTGYDFREVYPVLPKGVEISATRAWVPERFQPVLDAILVDMV